MKNRKSLSIILSLCLLTKSHATTPITLHLNQVPLPAAIQTIAHYLPINVILSTTITGQVTLHLQNIPPQEALTLILTSHNLEKWQTGNTWFIAPREELMKRKQEELKWHTTSDASSPLVMEIHQIHYAKATDIARILHDTHTTLLSKRGQLHVDARTNTLCIQDIQDRLNTLRRLIHRLDIPVKQISIAARLASVDSDFERELGVQFATEAPAASNSRRITTNEMHHAAGRYSIAIAKLADGSLLDIKLAALENAGHAELISSPSLFTANQQTASIEAGEEVPYQEVSQSGGTAIVFKKAVLSLKVTPQLLPGNRVLLQLHITQDRPSNRMVLGMPTIKTRQMTTHVLVRNGQTIVLGGIYETNHETDEQRLPFISRVPLIGWLFKERTSIENKRELLIFVTPTIMPYGGSR